MEDEENGIQLSLGLSVVGKVRRKSLIDINSEPQEEDEEEAHREECETTTLSKREVQAKRRQEAKRKREEKRQVKKDNNFSIIDKEGLRFGDVKASEFKRERLENCCPSRVVCSGPAYPPFGNGCGFSDGSNCRGPGPGAAWEESNCNNVGSNNGSGGCSSCVISENRSISSLGGCSSDTGSNLSRSKSGKTELDTSSGSETQEPAPSGPSQCTSGVNSGVNQTSHQLQSTNGVGVLRNDSEKATYSNTSVPCQVQPQEEAASGSLPNARINPSIPPVAVKLNKPDMGKPPKPVTNNHSVPAFAHMPCVSTTGNGPNGKTVTGFLYRYTKTEVSIICVCHGKSFSPTEFVEHAGGVDILHPLRQITVVPSL